MLLQFSVMVIGHKFQSHSHSYSPFRSPFTAPLNQPPTPPISNWNRAWAWISIRNLVHELNAFCFSISAADLCLWTAKATRIWSRCDWEKGHTIISSEKLILGGVRFNGYMCAVPLSSDEKELVVGKIHMGEESTCVKTWVKYKKRLD